MQLLVIYNISGLGGKHAQFNRKVSTKYPCLTGKCESDFMKTLWLKDFQNNGIVFFLYSSPRGTFLSFQHQKHPAVTDLVLLIAGITHRETRMRIWFPRFQNANHPSLEAPSETLGCW